MSKINSYDFLFNSSFSRFVGNPHQKLINSSQELSNFISANNGINPCFVTLNSFTQQYTIARTVFNDFDAEFNLTCNKCGTKIKESSTPFCFCGNRLSFTPEDQYSRLQKVYAKIRQAQQLYQTYQEYNITPVAHFTAYKGCHVFPLFKPEMVTDSTLITNLFYYFIEQAKTYSIQEVKDVEGKTTKLKVPYQDTVVSSDLRRLCRIPGTQRIENKLYCTAIPDFLSYEPEEIYAMAKNPHPSIEVPEPKQKMSEFEFTPVDVTKFRPNNTSSSVIDSTFRSLSDNVKQELYDMIPQYCIRTYLATIEPLHTVRYNATVHLRNIGYSPSGINDLFSRLGWRDYNESITAYQIGNIYHNPYRKLSLGKMRYQGMCDRTRCSYCR